jgi:hypothetical protein
MKSKLPLEELKRRKAAGDRAYRLRNKEKIDARIKRWCAENRDHLKRYKHQHYTANKERYAVLNRNWVAKHPANVKAVKRRHFERNRPAYYARARAHAKRYPEKVLARRNKRRAIQQACEINPEHIEAFIASVRAKRTVRCYYCDRRVSGRKAHIDHVLALSRRGPHEVGNLCASCPRCNLSKNNKPISAWPKSGQQILSI